MRKLLVYYLLALLAAKAAGKTLTLEEQFQEHLQKISRFSRAGPQPRLINVSEVVNLATHQRVEPAVTVLYRCDMQTGCCGAQDPVCYNCAPIYDHVTQVEVWFNIMDVFSYTNELRAVQMQNHTSCECVRICTEFD